MNFLSRGTPGLLFALLVASCCVYLSTYTARIETGDALRLADAASSLARYGDLGRDESTWVEPPTTLAGPYPFVPYEPTEAFSVVAASLFYRMADALPFGYVHAMYLLNIVTNALIVVTLFYFVRLLGYEDRIALLTAGLCGFGTLLWPYSKTLFREPLAGLLLLWVALCITLWKQLGLRRGAWLGLPLVLIFAGAFYTKNSVIFALPALGLWVLPDVTQQPRIRRASQMALLVGLFVLIAILYVPTVFERVAALLQWGTGLVGLSLTVSQDAPVALHSYLLSVGGSVWGTSPLLLLALPGATILLRRREAHLVGFVTLVVLGYAVGHAFFAVEHWFGGLSWPPRFLVPTVPFVALLLPPALDGVRRAQAAIWRWLAGGLIVYSVCVQVIAVVSRFDAYNQLLPPEADGLSEWLPGLNTVAYLRWVVLPNSWASLGLDIAWVRIGSPLYGIVLLVFGILLLRLCWHWLSVRNNGVLWGMMGSVMIALFLMIGCLIQLRNRDPEYWAHKQALPEVWAVLEAEARDGAPLILADNTYDEFVLNYNNLSAIRPVVLGFQPGEAVSAAQPPRVSGAFTPALLESYVPRLIDHLGDHHERLWLLAHNSPFLSWSVRPVEQFLSQNYYVLRVVTTSDPTVRLLEYSTVDAPGRYNLRLPQYQTDLRYGAHIRLVGFSLPQGTEYAVSDVLPLSLYWVSDAPLDTEYVVAWFVVGEDGLNAPVQGIDTLPDAGFAPTTGWQPGVPQWDNHALILPRDLPAGDYQIWVVLYALDSGGADRLAVMGTNTREGTIGILPITLQIVAQNS